MGSETDLWVNTLSYTLGAVSFFGFLIIARNEIGLWLHDLFSMHRPAAVTTGANAGAAARIEQTLATHARPARKTSIILGLVFMGLIASTALFILHAKAEQLQLSINLNFFMLIMLAFTMLPGGLTGVAAGAWINATRRIPQGHLLERLLDGIMVYLAFFTLFELTGIHLLLFLCGPAITLLVYQFSQSYNA